LLYFPPLWYFEGVSSEVINLPDKVFLDKGKLLDAIVDLLEWVNLNQFNREQLECLEIMQIKNNDGTITITLSITVPDKLP